MPTPRRETLQGVLCTACLIVTLILTNCITKAL